MSNVCLVSKRGLTVGKQITDDTAFCPYCGKPTPQGAAVTGTAASLDYDGIVALQGQPDPNDREQFLQIFRVIVLDRPQTLRLLQDGGKENEFFSNEAMLISLDSVDDVSQYMGQHITFSIDPANTRWPGDTLLPLEQPHTDDIHVLD